MLVFFGILTTSTALGVATKDYSLAIRCGIYQLLLAACIPLGIGMGFIAREIVGGEIPLEPALVAGGLSGAICGLLFALLFLTVMKLISRCLKAFMEGYQGK